MYARKRLCRRSRCAGLNYRTHKYHEAYDMLPQRVVLGSETASAVSSRGVYKWPVEISGNATYPDHQSNAYEVESCAWANIPEVDFALADDFPLDHGAVCLDWV